MSTFQSGLIAGVVAGAAVTGLAFLLSRSAPPPASERPPAASAPSEREARLEAENKALTKRIEALEKPAPAPAPAAPPEEKPKTDAAVPAKLGDLFGKLTESGLAGFRSPKFGEMLEAVKKEGKPALDFLANVLKTSTSATERFFAGALMEGAGDAAAIPALAEALKNDKDDMVRRMVSHAIAVLGTPAAEGPLKGAATGDSDWGVRVNSAYGLAKLQNDEGLRMLREAYESADTPAEYRLPILGGLADVAAPSTAPLFRKILADTKDVSYLLASIGALEKMKDTASLPALEQLAASAPSDIVKQAAAKAVDAIRK